MGGRVRDHVELITYPHRLAPGLRGLLALLDGPLDGLFGGVHVLPFYVPIDGSDAGFDPDDHRSVDARVGSWEDLEALSARRALTADLIVNHISARSVEFRDFLEGGERSPKTGMFLTFDTVFPAGASEADLLRIYRPRAGLPFTARSFADGTKRLLWTTFTAEQIDLDVESPAARSYLDEILEALVAHGVTTVRLDAVGYAIKRSGTSCFMLPETFGFIESLRGRCREHGLEVLVEVHAHHRRQVEIARQVDRVYDFALPPLVLHAFYAGDFGPLADWLEIRPENCVTVLDTHDGIGVVDVAAGADPVGEPGLLDAAAIDALVEGIHEHSGGSSRLATGEAASNLDLYQVNCTFYDALGRDDERYLAARLVQLFLPGRPQLYYVGLLAGENDMELLAETGVGRDVNRHYYSAGEVERACERVVVRALFAAIRLRNEHPAFDGEFSWELRSSRELELRWADGSSALELAVDAHRGTYDLRLIGPEGRTSLTSVADVGGMADVGG
jgi:sucrose phosphorylase